MTPRESRLVAAVAERYRIERALGARAMATVYLAEDLQHHRRVAVKVLRPDIAQAIGAERFLREIEIAVGLTHPHILADARVRASRRLPVLRNAVRPA